jgi:hypothetical protein
MLLSLCLACDRRSGGGALPSRELLRGGGARARGARDGRGHRAGRARAAPGRGLEPARRPPTLQLYADFARFRSATAALNPDAPEARGFTSRDGHTAHVTVEPASEVLRELGLSNQTRRLIAHEVTHLLCFDLLPDMTSLPGWMVEGLADSVAQEVLGSLGRTRAIEEEPWTAAQILEVQELVRANQAPRFGTLLLDRLGGFEYRQRYALRWLLASSSRRATPTSVRASSLRSGSVGGRALDRVQPLLETGLDAGQLAASTRVLAWVGALTPLAPGGVRVRRARLACSPASADAGPEPGRLRAPAFHVRASSASCRVAAAASCSRAAGSFVLASFTAAGA